MNTIANFMENKLGPIAAKMSTNKYILALRDGMAGILPIVIFGSIVMLITNFPYIEKVISSDTLATIQMYVGQSYQITMNISALLVSFTIAYHYCKRTGYDPLQGGIASLVSFLLIIPLTITDTEKLISLNVTSSTGLFVAIICGLVCAKLFTYLVNKGWTIKLPESVPEAINKSFVSLIPLCIIFIIFSIVRMLFQLTPYGNAVDFIFAILQKPLMGLGGNIFTCLIACFVNQFVWFFGIHPGGILAATYQPILMALSQENFNLIANGLEPINIINQQFYTVFFEGCGLCLPPVIAILIICKRKEYRDIAKIEAPAGLFNIGEPLCFGLPMVLNPYVLIPNTISPMIMLILGYLATILALVPICTVTLPWTTPAILSGFLGTGSIMGAIIQIIGLGISVLIWIPFLKMMEANANRQEKEIEQGGK